MHSVPTYQPPASHRHQVVAAWAPLPQPAVLPTATRSYNKVNNEPACLSKSLLTATLRQKLGFKGFVATDCDGALLAAASCLWLLGVRRASLLVVGSKAVAILPKFAYVSSVFPA